MLFGLDAQNTRNITALVGSTVEISNASSSDSYMISTIDSHGQTDIIYTNGAVNQKFSERYSVRKEEEIITMTIHNVTKSDANDYTFTNTEIVGHYTVIKLVVYGK